MTHTIKNNINNIFFDVFKRLSVSSYQSRSVCVNSPLCYSVNSCETDSLFDSLGIEDVTPARRNKQ